jgi:hypothetical protein
LCGRIPGGHHKQVVTDKLFKLNAAQAGDDLGSIGIDGSLQRQIAQLNRGKSRPVEIFTADDQAIGVEIKENTGDLELNAHVSWTRRIGGMRSQRKSACDTQRDKRQFNRN